MAITTLQPLNILGTPLQCCCANPLTGFYRDGFCRTDIQDAGRHVICAKITDAFLQFTLSMGNDLITPNPNYNFEGLKVNDKWCLCALRWLEAYNAGIAPPIYAECTSIKALEYTTIDILMANAIKI